MMITEIQRFCMHDGPGLRTVVFLKGCPLRCKWCHNPETQKCVPQMLFYPSKCITCGSCSVCPEHRHSFDNGIHRYLRSGCIACGECAAACPTGALSLSGTMQPTDSVFNEIMKDKAFFGKRGGATLSGGEPLLQTDACIELLKLCKDAGISTAIETAGYFKTDRLEELVSLTDLFLWDVKDTDEKRHKANTGVGFEQIRKNLFEVDRLGGITQLHCILVNGINTDEKHYREVAELKKILKNCIGVKFFPYHAYGGIKNTFLGDKDSGNAEWIPTASQLSEANAFLDC